MGRGAIILTRKGLFFSLLEKIHISSSKIYNDESLISNKYFWKLLKLCRYIQHVLTDKNVSNGPLLSFTFLEIQIPRDSG